MKMSLNTGNLAKHHALTLSLKWTTIHVYLKVYSYFFFQLYSLNEYKPPISKAKMTQITKSGIKAIKVSM